MYMYLYISWCISIVHIMYSGGSRNWKRGAYRQTAPARELCACTQNLYALVQQSERRKKGGPKPPGPPLGPPLMYMYMLLLVLCVCLPSCVYLLLVSCEEGVRNTDFWPTLVTESWLSSLYVDHWCSIDNPDGFLDKSRCFSLPACWTSNYLFHCRHISHRQRKPFPTGGGPPSSA